MRLRVGGACAIVLALLGACGKAPGITPDAAPPVDAAPDAPTDASVYDELAATLKAEMSTQGAQAATLAIVERGEVTYAHGFGRRRSNDATPPTPTTRFRIASLSKMLTAIGVLQQVEAGTIDLATPIAAAIPEVRVAAGAAWWPAVTAHDLLAHGSGMSRAYELDAGCPIDDGGLACWVTSQGFADNVWLMAPPRQVWSYSNVGYRVLGLLLERASGTSFRDYMQDHVFAPLGLARTTYDPAAVLADDDYAVSDSVGVVQHAEPWRRPSGGAFSTVLDLAKVAQFLMRGDEAVLPAHRLAQMTSAQVNTDWTLAYEQYGYGLFVDEGIALFDYYPYDFKTFIHDGLVPGYYAFLLVIPSHEFAFVFLSSGQLMFPIQSLELALHRILGLPVIAPLDLDEDPADFARYAGSYDYWSPDGGGTLTVALDGQTLRASGIMTCALVPQKVRNFTCGTEWLTFVGDDYVRWGNIVARRTGTGGM